MFSCFSGRPHGQSSAFSCRHARGEPWPGREHGPGMGHGHGRGRGGRLGRLFDHGDLRLVLLRLIADRPRHGYELIKAIEEMTGGAYSPSPGTIYPALTLLEEQELVQVTPCEGGKKLHSLTEAGRAHLDGNAAVVEVMLRRIEQAGARLAPPAPQIVRAMENLKLALRLRLDGPPPSEAQIQEIAGILDAAAGRIERT